MIVWLEELVSDQGTIVMFGGYTDIGHKHVVIAVDHRCAEPIAEALDDLGEVEVEVEGWQVL